MNKKKCASWWQGPSQGWREMGPPRDGLARLGIDGPAAGRMGASKDGWACLCAEGGSVEVEGMGGWLTLGTLIQSCTL